MILSGNRARLKNVAAMALFKELISIHLSKHE
jgi:hypothetical protein